MQVMGLAVERGGYRVQVMGLAVGVGDYWVQIVGLEMGLKMVGHTNIDQRQCFAPVSD